MRGQSSDRSRTLHERIVANIGQGILVLDRNGRVLAANPAVRETLKLSGEVEGRDAEAVLRGTPALARLAARGRADPAGRETEDLRLAVAGEWRTLRVGRSPLRDEDAAEGVILSLTDVTDRDAAELKARRAATLAGIGRLTSQVAHELKNPLGALKLYALLLERQLRDTRPEGRELAEKVARAVDQLSAMVSRVSTLTLPGPWEPAPLSLAGVLDDALARVAEQLGPAGIDVIRRYEAAPVTVRAAGEALRQAILSVIVNAIEAMPTGGTLTLGVARIAPHEVELTVRDTGGGISEEVQARLFEPFFTTKPQGLGLGMTIAHQVIEQHGGRVEVRSQPGEGTTVRVVLPADTQAEHHGRGTHPGR